MSTHNQGKIDRLLILVSLSVIVCVVIALAVAPEQGTAVAKMLYSTIAQQFGSFFLLFAFFSALLLAYIAISKYGNIKLGSDKPEYSIFTYLAMMACAGLGSATVYWAFLEWGYYYNMPPFGIAPHSKMAAEWATSYNFFHWGISAWTLYCIGSLPVAYSFHVKKNPQLKLSAVCSSILGRYYMPVLGKLIDIIFIFSCVGAMGITLGLSIPLVAEGVADLLGIQSSFTTEVVLILFITVIFSLSSYVGIDKGMSKLSDLNTKIAIGFVLVILMIGPTSFIIKETTNGYGLMLQNFIRMSLWSDPLTQGDTFPVSWTIFYWAYWMTYVPFMAIFVTKVSRGRTLREVITCIVLGGSAGCFIFFGILGSFSMHLQLTGVLDISKHLNEAMVLSILHTLPWSPIFIAVFVLMSMLFLATTLDSASFTLAAVTSNQLNERANPSTALKLFWCVILCALPLTMMFIGSPLKTLQTLAITTSLPLLLIIIVMVVGLWRWLKEDQYRTLPTNESHS